jgi:type VI secretion system protein ImpJ
MTFSMEGHPRDLPRYDHADLTGTFSQIDKKLQSLLGKVISPQNFVSIPLERKTENIYEGNIRDDALFVSGIFFLAVEGGDVSQGDIIEYIPIKLKISSADTIYDILSSAMPGVGLIHVPIPPPSLPIKVGYEYFRLESTGELWIRARESGKLAIYLPKELVSIDIKLIVLKDRK